MNLLNKDFISTHGFTDLELLNLLDYALEMKKNRFKDTQNNLLKNKTFLMFFYNPSVRTHISFVTAVTELGGHAEFFTPNMARVKKFNIAGEQIKDIAKTLSRYVAGIGIRIAEDQVPQYGDGHLLQLEYAKWADVPIINMASDRFHPAQGLADIMGWAEWYGKGRGYPNYANLRGKNLLLTWAKGKLARGWCSVQETLLLASRFGLNITLARPEGYDLDPLICQWAQENCRNNNADFRVISNPEEGYQGAHIVYSRNWVSPYAYCNGIYQKEKEIMQALAFKDWIVTTERMQRTENAIYTHCMPVDRGNEVVDEIVDSSHCVIYDVAENRLHVEKAILAATLAQQV